MLRIVLSTLLLIATPSAVAMASSATPTTTCTTTAHSNATTDTANCFSQQTVNRYQKRQKQSPKANEFKGGDRLVIGISGSALLVIVLLIVLL